MTKNRLGEQQIAQTLDEQAARAVPDTLDPWPAMVSRLTLQAGQRARPSALPGRTGVQPRRAGRGARRGRLLVGGAAALGILLVVTLATGRVPPLGGPPVAAAALLQQADAASSFVPPGKVRHLTIRTTESSAATAFTPIPSTYEVWLINGRSHLLLRKKGPAPDTDLLVGEDAVWDYKPAWSPGIVRMYPYTPSQLANFVPNRAILTQMAQMPETRVVPDARLDGRPVLLLERVGNVAPGTPTNSDAFQGVLLYRVWLDPTTYQVLQHEHQIREAANARFTDKVDSGQSTIVRDEVRDRSELPDDFFTFNLPKDTRLVEVPGASAPGTP